RQPRHGHQRPLHRESAGRHLGIRRGPGRYSLLLQQGSTELEAVMNIKRLLIANRGEIACRVIRTCKKLGIESVAVFSDADRRARHVQMADLACHIGGSAASESYLNAQSIIDAALKVKADAIHPGYGFLSESTQLISLCNKHGIIFVGPTVESIAAMGSKIEAKLIARELDIP